MRTNYHRGRDREYLAVNRARQFGLPAKRFKVSGQGEADRADVEIAGLRFQSKYQKNGFRSAYKELEEKSIFGLIIPAFQKESLAVIRFSDLLKLLKLGNSSLAEPQQGPITLYPVQSASKKGNHPKNKLGN